MVTVELDSPSDVTGWRRAARELLRADVPPEQVDWRVRYRSGSAPLTPRATAAGFGKVADELPAGDIRVPRRFVELAEAALHSAIPDRFDLTYRVLWRLQSDPGLMDAADPDTRRLRDWERSVRLDVQRLKAFVRFQKLRDAIGDIHVGWFDPEHFVLELAAPLLQRRFGACRWALFTPKGSVYSDADGFVFGPPVSRPESDRSAERGYVASKRMLETLWARNASIAFATARLTVSGERDRGQSVTDAGWEDAVDGQARQDEKGHVSRRSPADEPAMSSLLALREELNACRACELHRNASQAVAGRGAGDARIVLVGEQPGDEEDRAGKPFVGPAGRVLADALRLAGLEPADVYITNAVKHFKFEERGKRRMHKKPGVREVRACRWWLHEELRLLAPRVIVALGATAQIALTGSSAPARDEALPEPEKSPEGIAVLRTVHPAFVLRIPDLAGQERAMDKLVAALRAARDMAERSATH